MRSPGNTPGGMGSYLIGLMIALASLANLQHLVYVYGGYFSFGASPTAVFGSVAIATLAGCVILFFDGKALIGLFLGLFGLLAVFIGVLVHAGEYHRGGDTWNMIFGLFGTFTGVGLVFRAVVPETPKPPPPDHN